MNTIFRLKIAFSIFFLCVGAWSLFAQKSGASIFDESFIHRVDLQFDQADYLDQLTNNYENADIGNVPYIIASVTIDGEEVDSIGARFKGFTSYDGVGDKRPFKLDFNEYVPGQRLDGLRKLNLNNSTGDPSLHRDPVAYRMMREMGVPAPRTSFTELYVNGELWGVYQLIEQVDKEFLDLNYASDKGNLYKNLGWSKLENIGSTSDPYKEIFGLKTNQDEDDWSGFVNFVEFLNTSDNVSFESEIETYFNTDQFLRVLAVDVALNNWDSYLEHGRNYYLYQDKASGVFNWIPWDYNFAVPGGPNSGLGGGGGSDDCFVFIYGAGITNGTTTVQFGENTDGNADSLVFLWDFGDGSTSTERNPVHTYDDPGTYFVEVSVTGDGECSDFDGFQINTDDDPAECSAIDGSANAPSLGVPFLLTIRFEPQCCDQWSAYCDDAYGWFGGSSGGGGFGLTDFTIDQRQNDGVLISRLLNIPKYYERYQAYMCDLVGGALDSTSILQYVLANETLLSPVVDRDPNFPGGLSAFQESMGPDGIKYILADREADLALELDTVANCLPAPLLQFQEVVINEVAASMDSLSQVADGAGQHDDWIELYNPSSTSIDLTGAYLSDTRDDLEKWRFPYGSVILPQGYLVAWADKGLGQPGIHTSFRLKRAGDQVILSAADGTVVDSVSFDEQTTNVTYARLPNGTGPFQSTTPTIGANNDGSSSTSQPEVSGELNIFPNPASTTMTIRFAELEGEAAFQVTSSTGQVLHQRSIQSQGQKSLDVSTFAQGVYHLTVKHESGVLTRRFVVLAR